MNLAFFFGGASVEHEISVISACQAMNAASTEKYNVIPVYIAKNKRMYTGDMLKDTASYKDMETLFKNCKEVCFIAGTPSASMCELKRKGDKVKTGKILAKIDLAIPVVHGTNCEDGSLMGYFELMGIPYASCDVLSSAAGMDKEFSKCILKAHGVPVVDYVAFRASEYFDDKAKMLDMIEEKLGYPVIVKPANLGSSIGISKAGTREKLEESLDLAATFAPKLLIEHAVVNLREINCSVLGSADMPECSVLEEPVMHDEVLSYRDKYMGGGAKSAKGAKQAPAKGAKSGGMSSLARKVPADLPDEIANKIKEYAKTTFRVLGCNGVSRIDFLLDGEDVYVNEINTIPGSLSFYLWEAAGLSFEGLIDKIVECGINAQREKSKLNFDCGVNVLGGK